VRSATPEELTKLRLLAEKSLYFYAKGILGFKDLVPHVHGKVCRFLQGPEKRKSLILPRRFFKTTIASIAFPSWRANKIVARSYST